MSKFAVTFPRYYSEDGGKIHVIKAIRELTGLGLKESKDACEATGPQIFNLVPYHDDVRITGDAFVKTQYNILRDHGCFIEVPISAPATDILADLRALAVKAIQTGQESWAIQILSLINVNK